MPDSFIVTVASGKFEVDLEIPSRLAFANIKDKLLEILKILDEHEFQEWGVFSLRHKGRILADDETLADIGAFDGARLAAEQKRQVPHERRART
jgi:uncharacterized ubiquitin-like protein YukD